MLTCPCHSGKPYANCCEPFHKGSLPATCEQLMRSRYSAYSLGLVDYIIETTHPDLPVDRKSTEDFCKNTQFENLRILNATDDTVTFHATLSQAGHDVSFTEQSTFAKIDGKWLYQKGQH